MDEEQEQSVFITKREEIKAAKYLDDLILYLHDPEQNPLDVDAYLAQFEDDRLVLVASVVESHAGGDPEFSKYAKKLKRAR